jgi:O-antigen/teichoic acid export membrane protein
MHKTPVLKQGLSQREVDDADRSIWRRLRRNVSLSILGSGFSVAIKFGQTILLTRFLKIEDYGRLLIVLNLFMFLDSFFGLRVSDVMFRFFQSLKEQGNALALKSLLQFCLAICLASGLLIYLGVLSVSPWLARHLYENPGLSPLFNIYGCTIVVSAFSGIYQPILRIYDRFSAIVVPQIIGSLLTLVFLFIYFAQANGGSYDLRVIVAAFAVGILVQIIPPLVQALRLVHPFLVHVEAQKVTSDLTNFRPQLVRCLFNSNLSGYLKFAIDPGDVFLLGLFSSPTQVALYGLAKQLTSPLALLQTTIQTAITPEITNLMARLKLEHLQRLVRRWVQSSILFGGLLLLGAVVVGRLLILHFFAGQYAAALPIFYCLVFAAWLLLVLLVFRPLAISLDLLKWHNLALLVSTLVVLVLVVAGKLTALTMASVQLAEAAILRFCFSLLVWKKLRDRQAGYVGHPLDS